MLGLVDKSARRALFAALLAGEPAAMLDEVERQYGLGVDPLALLRSLMELTHRVALAQVGGGTVDAPSLEERADIEGWAQRLSAGQVHRLWQLLLKGHDEVRTAPDPLASVQMALLRVLHAADLPDPGTLARQLGEMIASGPAPTAAGPDPAIAAPAGIAAPAATLDWRALCGQVEEAGQLRVANLMRDWLRVIALAPGRLVYAPAPGLSEDPATMVRDALRQVTGEPWQVERGEGEGTPTLREQAEAARRAEADRIRSAPLVQAALAAFPGAELIDDDDDDAPPGAQWSRQA
jgi:DNA polymerase-3 subunit gamma/tau